MLHEDSGANENMSEKLSLENELLCVVKRISKMCFFFLICITDPIDLAFKFTTFKRYLFFERLI